MDKDINVAVGGPVNADYPKVYKTKFLKPGIPFASQVTEPNIKYVIKHNFDLDGETVTIPEGCLLEFDGGAISNGTIIGNYTSIIHDNKKIFTNIEFEGTWSDSVIVPQNFGAKLDGITDDTTALNKFFYTLFKTNFVGYAKGTALISDTITIGCAVNLPELDFVTTSGFNKNGIFIDNYRMSDEVGTQTNENMIRDVTIVLGSIYCRNTNSELYDNAGIKVSSCREIILIAEKIMNFKRGLLLEAYDNTCGLISYSTFCVRYILNCSSGLCFRTINKYGRGKGYNTECVFRDSKIACHTNKWDEIVFIDMRNDSGGVMDGHVFDSLCLEGAQDKVVDGRTIQKWAAIFYKSWGNVFFGCRFEGAKAGAILRQDDGSNNKNVFIANKSITNFLAFSPLEKFKVIGSPLVYASYDTLLGDIFPIDINLAFANYANLSTGFRNLTWNNFDDVTKVVNNEEQTIHYAPKSEAKSGAAVACISEGREGTFVLWTPNSSNQDLYFTKAYSRDVYTNADKTVFSNAESNETPFKINFREWTKFVRRSVDGATAGNGRVPSPINPQPCELYLGSDGFQTYLPKISAINFDAGWYNKEGYSGKISSYFTDALPTKPKNGSLYLMVYDHYALPIWYNNDRNIWVRYDGNPYNIKVSGSNHGDVVPKFSGTQFFNTTLYKPVFYHSSKWYEADGAVEAVNRSGTYAQKPTDASQIYEGFQYMINDTSSSPEKHFPIFAHISGNTISWYRADGKLYQGT